MSCQYSINHALVSLTEAIKNSLDNRKFGCGIFLDLQKTSDTDNHDTLLLKFEYYRIGGIAFDWFKSYLSDRKQYLLINGSKSNGLSVVFAPHTAGKDPESSGAYYLAYLNQNKKGHLISNVS